MIPFLKINDMLSYLLYKHGINPEDFYIRYLRQYTEYVLRCFSAKYDLRLCKIGLCLSKSKHLWDQPTFHFPSEGELLEKQIDLEVFAYNIEAYWDYDPLVLTSFNLPKTEFDKWLYLTEENDVKWNTWDGDRKFLLNPFLLTDLLESLQAMSDNLQRGDHLYYYLKYDADTIASRAEIVFKSYEL